MSVVKLDQVGLSNITLDDPIKQDSLYLSKINHHGKDLIIQTPKLLVVARYGNDTIEVKLNDELKYFLDTYDQFMINIISKKSPNWFSKEISKSKVAQIYKKSNVMCDDINLACFKIDENVKVYSNDKELTLDSLDKNMEVILLIHASYLVFYKANCIPYFNTVHIKIKEKKIEHEFRDIEEESSDKIPVKINVDDFEFK